MRKQEGEKGASLQGHRFKLSDMYVLIGQANASTPLNGTAASPKGKTAAKPKKAATVVKDSNTKRAKQLKSPTRTLFDAGEPRAQSKPAVSTVCSAHGFCKPACLSGEGTGVCAWMLRLAVYCRSLQSWGGAIGACGPRRSSETPAQKRLAHQGHSLQSCISFPTSSN